MPITVPTRATDWSVIEDDARASLIANTTIATTLAIVSNPKRIAPHIIEEGITYPYIVLQFTPVYNSTYGNPSVNGLLDVSCYTAGSDTTMVRALMRACLSALIDTPWVTTAMTAANVTLLSANMEEAGAGLRDLDEVIQGTIIRGKQATIRVRAERTA